MNYLQLYIYVYVGKVDGISQQLDMSSDNPKEWKEMKVFDYIYMCIFIHIEIYVYISFYMHMCLYIQIQILLVLFILSLQMYLSLYVKSFVFYLL
jgi:hypothetical protein